MFNAFIGEVELLNPLALIYHGDCEDAENHFYGCFAANDLKLPEGFYISGTDDELTHITNKHTVGAYEDYYYTKVPNEVALGKVYSDLRLFH